MMLHALLNHGVSQRNIYYRLILRFTLCFIFMLFFCAAKATAQEIPAELILRAFNYCYPGKTGEVSQLDGDWTIMAGKEIFYWAGGRLLPGSLRHKQDAYAPHNFEIYPENAPQPSSFSKEYAEALRIHGAMESLRLNNEQHYGFLGILYGSTNRREIESNLSRITFLGKNISVNRSIAAALRRIDSKIREAGAADTAEGKQIREFIDSIEQIGGYNWREIRGSSRMSYHSWGLAVDIQPKKTDAAMYWLWERSRNEDWMLIPLKDRWSPPDAVIRLFEQEGFIWGGKWVLFDNMHFEYRPELHELKRLLASADSSYSVSGAQGRAASRDLHHIYPDGVLGD